LERRLPGLNDNTLAVRYYSPMITKRKLLDQVSDVAWFSHLNLRTEQAHRNWIRRYIFFHHSAIPGTSTMAGPTRF
jgi:hypothetical protein